MITDEFLAEILRVGPSTLFRFSFPELRCTYISPPITDMLGYAVDDWLVDPCFWQNHLHPDDKERMITEYSHLSPTRNSVTFDYRMRHRDGHYIWVRNRIKLLSDENQPTVICGGMIEITKEKIKEFQTEILMNRYKTMVSSLYEGVLLIDLEGNFVECNQSACNILELPYETLKLMNTFTSDWHAITEDNQPFLTHELPINRTLTTGLKIDGAIMGLKYPNHTRWLAVNTCRITIPELSKAIGGLITFTEITKRVEADRLLAESEQRYKTISEMTSDFIFYISIPGPRQYEIEWTSGNLNSILGLPEGTLKKFPEDYFQMIHRDDRAGLATAWTHVEKNKQVTNIHRVIPYPGVTKWMETIISPIYDTKKHQLTHILGTMKDITALKQAETTLHELSQEIIQTQEKERNMLARELHDNVGQAAPSILLHLKNLSRLHQDSETQHVLATAEAELRQMNDSIRLIHSWLEPKTLNILGLKAAVEEAVKSMADAVGISAVVHLEGLDDVSSQESHIHIFRLVQEGVRNAIKHSGGDTVIVRAQSHRHGIMITIQDNGQGFLPQTRELKGHFGLSIMEERARLIKGKLKIRSILHKGTKVRIYIPKAGTYH